MRRSGFTLVEVLIAALLSAVACVVAMQAARQAVNLMERISGRTLAWERGQNALSIIEPRALHAALGITYSSDVFTRSFGAGGRSAPPPAQWRDRGPLQIWDGYPLDLVLDEDGVFKGSGIAILYAVPGALRVGTDSPVVLSADLPAVIKLVPGAPDVSVRSITDRLTTEDKSDLWSWVTFPLTRLPMYAVPSEYSEDELVVTTYVSRVPGVQDVLYPYDEIHYLRAERFYVMNDTDTMYSEELRTSWTQIETRIDGVLAMWFQWTPAKKLLEAWILTSGGRGSSGRPEEWPAEAPWLARFGLHDTVVVRGSWVLKNM